MAMDSRQISYLLTVCEELHFTRAARRCGISQPSLSNAIRALEREFGGPLVHRRPHPRLSELGRSVQPHLRRALVEIEQARSLARPAPSRSRAHADHGRYRPLPHLGEDRRNVAEPLA
jgi:DNA-binding transcriptional LysR family regulator